VDHWPGDRSVKAVDNGRAGQGPSGDAAEQVADVTRSLLRALGWWSAAWLAGAAAAEVRGRRPGHEPGIEMAAFTRHSASWAGVDGVIAALGALRRPSAAKTAVRERRRLRRLLVVNTVADVGYVAGGMGLLRRGRPGDRGTGSAVIVQGAFLLVLDGTAARRLGRG
jgi:hypothetical protein